MAPRDEALRRAARQAVRAEASRRLAAAIQARDYLAVQVDHLTLGINPQTGASVVQDRCGPCCIERWLGDGIERPWFAEIEVPAQLNETVISANGFLEIAGRHRNALVFHFDLAGELADGIGREEVASVNVDIWRFRIPLLAFNRCGIEDRPDRASAVMAIPYPRHRSVDPVVRLEPHIF